MSNKTLVSLVTSLIIMSGIFMKNVYAQTFPAKNDTLNFTSLCFQFPWDSKAEKHTLLLIQGRTEIRKTSLANKIIVNNLQENKSYKWTVIYQDDKGNVIKIMDTASFFIAPFPTDVRYRFITNDTINRGNDMVIFDYALSAINRNGETVWYLPRMKPTVGIRDLRMTDDGTFTAIIDSNAVEMDIKGNVLWKAPDDGAVSRLKRENYHHHFQKLPNGNYLVLGSEFKKYKLPQLADSVSVEMGTIIEYTPDKKIAWVWRSSDFFKAEWIPFVMKDDKFIGKVHLNAVNISNGFVYAGFRDVSWIIKLEKETKKVVAIYGGNDSKLPFHYAKKMFRYQHDVLVLRDGSIGIVNNDSIDAPAVISSVILFSEKKGNEGQKVFEFPFNYDANSNGKSSKLGNLLELSNGNLLVNMGGINRIFEITRDKKIVWDVFVEKYDSFKKVWHFFPQYRVNAVSSLYPNEFSVKMSKANSGDRNSCYYFIMNVGSETNSYTIYGDKSGKKIKLASTGNLKNGEFASAGIALPAEFRAKKNISIYIEVNGKSKQEKLIYPN